MTERLATESAVSTVASFLGGPPRTTADVIGLVVVAIIAIGALVYLLVHFNGGKLGPISFNHRRKEENARAKKLRKEGKDPSTYPPHYFCPHAGDIISVVARTSELVEYRHTVKLETIEAQMRYLEEQALDIEGLAMKIFISALSDKGVVEPAQHPDCLTYKALVRAIVYKVKDYYRVAMRTNHFTSYSPQQWREYIENKASALVQVVTEELNIYWRGVTISRSELYEINRSSKLIPAFNEAIEASLAFALEAARQAEATYERKFKEHEQWLKENITG